MKSILQVNPKIKNPFYECTQNSSPPHLLTSYIDKKLNGFGGFAVGGEQVGNLSLLTSSLFSLDM